MIRIEMDREDLFEYIKHTYTTDRFSDKGLREIIDLMEEWCEESGESIMNLDNWLYESSEYTFDQFMEEVVDPTEYPDEKTIKDKYYLEDWINEYIANQGYMGTANAFNDMVVTIH